MVTVDAAARLCGSACGVRSGARHVAEATAEFLNSLLEPGDRRR